MKTSTTKLGVVVCTSDPSTPEVEAGESYVQERHPQLHSGFKASQGFMRLCLKKIKFCPFYTCCWLWLFGILRPLWKPESFFKTSGCSSISVVRDVLEGWKGFLTEIVNQNNWRRQDSQSHTWSKQNKPFLLSTFKFFGLSKHLMNENQANTLILPENKRTPYKHNIHIRTHTPL